MRHKPKLGTWFGVPLQDDKWALGLITRTENLPRAMYKSVFAYFFGPAVNNWEEYLVNGPIQRRPGERVHFCRFGDRKIVKGEWPIIGQIVPFDSQAWPLPPFKNGPIGGGPDWQRRFLLRKHNDFLEPYGPEEEVLLDDPDAYPWYAWDGSKYLQDELSERLLKK